MKNIVIKNKTRQFQNKFKLNDGSFRTDLYKLKKLLNSL